MKIQLIWHNEELIEHNCDKPYFESKETALQNEITNLEHEMQPWINEAKAAIELNDLYRGGGILKLAELMRKHSRCRGRLAGLKHIQQ